MTEAFSGQPLKLTSD